VTSKEHHVPGRIRAIIFDMDNTLFDFVAAKQHACREVARFLGRDDWEALFNCFINSPHGFESHENIRDYFEKHIGFSQTAKADFDLCGLLERCSAGKNTDNGGSVSPVCCPPSSEKGAVLATPDEKKEEGGKTPDSPSAPAQAVPTDFPPPGRENVVRIRISQVNPSPARSSPSRTPGSEAQTGNQQISIPSACAIPSRTASTQPPRRPVRDNLVADRSLYCNQVFSRCCAIYEAEKVRVLEPYPGVRETLEELKRRGLPLAIVTDAHNGNALLRLRRTGLAEFFDYIVTYDMTGAKKPAPDAFLLALEKLGTKPPETLLVGDSIRRDIAPAKELGMVTAYAAYGDRNVRSRDPPDVRPDYVLGSIEELLNLAE